VVRDGASFNLRQTAHQLLREFTPTLFNYYYTCVLVISVDELLVKRALSVLVYVIERVFY